MTLHVLPGRKVSRLTASLPLDWQPWVESRES
jgi:hypothetical protein